MDDFVRDLFKKAAVDDLLRCILICSEARVVRVKETDKVISNFQEEKILLKFAKTCQFLLEYTSLRGRRGTCIQIKTRNTISQYHALGQSASFAERNKFSIVAATYKGFNTIAGNKITFDDQNINFDDAYIYVKGSYTSLRQLLNVQSDQAENIDQVAEKMYQAGQMPLVFARKKLTKEQAEEFVQRYKNFKTNLSVQPEALESIFGALENNLEFVGMITCGQEYVTPILETLETLKQAGITTWIVSNEPFENLLLLLRSHEILDHNTSRFFIDGESQESVVISMKMHMSQFRKVFEKEKQALVRENITQGLNAYHNSLSENVLKKMNGYSIVISGRAFQFIRNDKISYNNFALLCAVCTKVIGFGFSAENKQALINMARDKFSNENQVMAIGTSYSDIPMLNSADIGVFCTNFKENSLLPWGDIKTSDLTKLQKMLLEQGVAFTHQIDHSIYYLFYKSVALTMPLFYYNWFSSMTGTSIYDSVLLFLFNFIFTLLPILSLSFDQPFSKEYIQAFPAFYAESRSKKLHPVKKFIVRVWVEGMVHSTLVFYFCLYHICYCADARANPGDFGILSLVIVMSLIFIVNFKVRLHYPSYELIFL